MGQLTIELPESIPAEEARLELAIGLYRSGRLRQGEAAQLADMAPPAFVETLATRDIPAVRIDLSEVEAQVAQLKARDDRWKKIIIIGALSVVGAFCLWILLVCAGAFDDSFQRYYVLRGAAAELAHEWEELRSEFPNQADDILVDLDARYSTVEFYRFQGDSVDGVILVPTGGFYKSPAPLRILISTDEFETIEQGPVLPVGWKE